MAPKPLLPLAFSRNPAGSPQSLLILAADVGGTKTNMALFREGVNGLTLLREARYASQEYHSLLDIIRQFQGSDQPDRICMAVAGPVMQGRVRLTNLTWELDAPAMSAALKVPLVFINDLEATGYGLAGLPANQLATLHEGKEKEGGNIAIVAAGTGLGEAGLYFDGSRYHPFATEGGHSDFSPRTEQDLGIWRWLNKKYGHVSWERLVSGPGLHTIFEYLCKVEKKAVEPWVAEQMQTEDPSAVISNAAIYQQEPACLEALQLFIRYLAMESASLVLKLKSTGGCYLGGGIAPKILPALEGGDWYRHFVDAGRMQPLLETVPVKVILDSKTALLGAAWYGAYNME